MKCLEKDRARRYETANGLATDVQRHLTNEPVLARPPGNLYRLQKTVRRHKLAFAAAGAVLVSLVLGLAATTVMFFKEQAALRGEKAARAQVAQQKSEVELKKAEVERKNAEFRAMLVEAARSDRFVAEEKLRSGQEQSAFAHLARACEYDPSSTLAAEKGIAALNVWNYILPVSILAGHEADVWNAQFSPDGTRLVTRSADWTARVWDAATGKALATITGHTNVVWSAQFSPDGTRLVTASADKTAWLWDALPKSAGPPPEWFPDFLRYMAQMRLNSDGELETLKPADWLALRERLRGVLRANANAETPYLRILRKYVRG
jgi:hypothetical protein